MYISLNWIKDFVDLDGINIDEVVNKFTLSCAEVEGVIYKGRDISGIITARIESVENHPNSKKLHLLKVNTGKELVDVVCGAPNVRVGMITAFATLGAKVGEMTIAKTAIAGCDSSGMCCSEKEIGISDDHSGIMEFSEDTKIGVDIKELLPIEDILIEVDNKSLTNRPDMWGHYGIAREIAAITGRKLKEYVVDSEDYSKNPGLDVKVISPSCNRYSALKIENISKNVSPEFMRIRLYYCGMRAISLLADLTNYIMLELGQPMHSFNGDMVKSIIVRDVEEDTPFTTLDGVERVLPKDTMVIDLNGELGAIAGVMGGLSSEIESDTNSTFLESANFDSVKVRKTATALGLRSESSARYEKSLDPEMTITALLRYVHLLKSVDGGIKVVSNITDVYMNKYPNIKIYVSKEYIDRYTGAEITKDRMVDILSSLGFGVKVDGENFEIDVPTWRATKDISVKADIVEEITRVFGYDNIIAKPIKQPIVPKKLGVDFVRNYDIKYALADKYNMHEIHSNIWEDAMENKRLGIETKSYIHLVNSLQKDNDDIRSTMMPTILRALEQNKKYKNSFGLFEIGHIVTGIVDNLAKEEISLGMGFMFDKENLAEELINVKNRVQYIFDYILSLPVKVVRSETTENYLCNVNYYNIMVSDDMVGTIGVVHPRVQQKIDNSKYIIISEINISKVNQYSSSQITIEKLSKYPVTTLDFNFVLDVNDVYGTIENITTTVQSDLTYKCELLDIFHNSSDNTKSYTIRYYVTSMDHTLSSEEIENFHKNVITTFENNNIHLKAE